MRRINMRHRQRIALYIALLWVIPLQTNAATVIAQEDTEAAIATTITIDYRGVELQLDGATNPLPLPQGAVAPIRVGDVVRTDDTGRATIDLLGSGEILLLPNSTFSFTVLMQDENDTPTVAMTLDGTLIQRTRSQAVNYMLQTAQLHITQPAIAFAVWSRTDSPDVVAVVGGRLTLQADDETFTLSRNQGFWADETAPTVADITPPLNAARIDAQLNGCIGTVQTTGGVELRVRNGTTTEFTAMGAVPDGEQIALLGVTESGTRYRVQYLSDYGWVEAVAIQNDCTDLPIFPDITGEQSLTVTNALRPTIDLLRPYFGSPADNLWFYRTEPIAAQQNESN